MMSVELTLSGTVHDVSWYHYFVLVFLGFVPLFAIFFDGVRTASWYKWLWSINVFIFIYSAFLFLRGVISMISDMRNKQFQMLYRWRAASEIKEDFDHRNGHLLNMPIKNAVLFIIIGWCQLGLIILFIYFEIYDLWDKTSPLSDGPDYVLRTNSLILCATLIQCTYFRLDFADELYHSVCGFLHKRCKRFCERIADRKKRTRSVQVRRVVEGTAVEMTQLGAETQPLLIHEQTQWIQVGDDSISLESKEYEDGILSHHNVTSSEPNTQNTSGLQSEIASRLIGFDLTVFGDTLSECNQSTNTSFITSQCPCLQRLYAGLEYVKILTDRTDLNHAKKMEMFIQFNQQTYKSVLDDSIHLFQKHSNDILQIHKEWTRQYAHSKCSINECMQTNRHCSRRTKMQIDQNFKSDEDYSYSFYNELYDRVHFYIFHLFDVGLRVEQGQWSIEQKDAEYEQDDGQQRVYVDREFAAQRNQIVSKKKNSGVQDLDIVGNKFVLQALQKQQGLTVTDAVITRLAENETTGTEKVERFQAFLDKNAVDSDAMEMDLEDLEDSNLNQIINGRVVVDLMQSVTCMFV